MSSRIERLLVVDERLMDGIVGDQTYDSVTIDLRVGTPRIEAVVARGRIGAPFGPSYKIEWAGGIDTAEIDGQSTGGTDKFQPFGTNPTLICTDAVVGLTPEGTTERSGDWLIASLPTILWPYVRFRVTAVALSPIGSTFSLYLILRKRFDS